MTNPSDTSAVDASASSDGRRSIAETRPLYWSVRRELWENRYLFIAPVVVTAFVLFGSFVTMVTTAHRMRTFGAQDPARLLKAFHMAPAPIMFATFLIGLFYSLDALYGERRDRSILFWKSLPVSDKTTVLSKASIPIVVLPLIAFGLSVLTQFILGLLSVPIFLGNGISPVAVWGDYRFFQGLLIMLYGLTVHALWFAPVYAWLLLLSAWARRATLLWAVFPPLLLAAMERILFNTWSFMRMLQYRMTGAMTEGFAMHLRGGDGDIGSLSQLSPVRFLSAPGLWVGLIFAAIFLGLSIRLRRNREPI